MGYAQLTRRQANPGTQNPTPAPGCRQQSLPKPAKFPFPLIKTPLNPKKIGDHLVQRGDKQQGERKTEDPATERGSACETISPRLVSLDGLVTSAARKGEGGRIQRWVDPVNEKSSTQETRGPHTARGKGPLTYFSLKSKHTSDMSHCGTRLAPAEFVEAEPF